MFKKLGSFFGIKTPETASPGTIDIKLSDLHDVLRPLILPQNEVSIQAQVCEALETMSRWINMSSPSVPIQSIVGLNTAVTNLRETLKIKDQSTHAVETDILQSIFDHRDTLSQVGRFFVRLHETPDTKPTLSVVDRASMAAEIFSMNASFCVEPTPAQGETFNSMGQKLLAVDNNLTNFFLHYDIKAKSPNILEMPSSPLPKLSDPELM
ncbi:MAG: hypothetical protein J0L77_07975 [Alphaproteobacteria bacterium]|nr:hypothetical protein [Alphaproteobacteria bacterium]